MNHGHAEYLFFLLAGLMGVFFLGFLVAAKLYKYKPHEQGTDTEIVPRKNDCASPDSVESHLSSQENTATQFW